MKKKQRLIYSDLALIEFDTEMGRISFKPQGIYRKNKKVKDWCEIAEIANQIWLAGYFEGKNEKT